MFLRSNLGQLRAHLVYVVAGRCGERCGCDALVDPLDLRPPHPLELGSVFRVRCLDGWYVSRGPDRIWWAFAFACHPLSARIAVSQSQRTSPIRSFPCYKVRFESGTQLTSREAMSGKIGPHSNSPDTG